MSLTSTKSNRINKTNKKVVYTIEYSAEPEDMNLSELLEKMREYGSATVTDVRIEVTTRDDDD
jgi:endo-alpha-1,4-polygalactosaminidase (GH114 family)